MNASKHTLDDLSDANGNDKCATANRGVESGFQLRQFLNCGASWQAPKKGISGDLLGALVVWLALVFQEAGVFNGDSVANLGDGAIALCENGLGNTHCCGGSCEVARSVGGRGCRCGDGESGKFGCGRKSKLTLQMGK
jgi:hypothetical protein